jgi:signal transduction histidine kinase
LAIACVLVASLWEAAFLPRSGRQRLAAFEKRLHQEEKWADEMLEELKGEKEPHWTRWKHKGFTLLGFKRQRLVYWNNERVGVPGLYQALRSGGRFVKFNNAYYDVRVRAAGEMEYFALLFLQDDYPHVNRHVKNRVNPALGSSLLRVIADDAPGSVVVHNRDGEPLFRVDEETGGGARVPGHLVLVLYVVALYLVFYAYKLGLTAAPTLRVQLIWVLAFVAFFVLSRWSMFYFKVPYSLYHLAIPRADATRWSLAWPVGDLFLSTFCLVHFLFLSFQNIRLPFQERWLTRYKYLFLFSLSLLTFVYMNAITCSVDSLIENTRVSLNMARIMNVDISSIMAFITLVIGAMGLLVLVDGSVRYFSRLLSLRQVITGVGVVWGGFTLSCAVLDLPLAWKASLFALLLHLLLIVNIYLVKGEARRSVFLVAIVLVAAYITGVSQRSEMQREWAIRAGYANEIIRERDEVFEEKLVEVDQKITHSRALDSMIRHEDQSVVSRFLLEKLTDLTGYHYTGKVVVSTGEAARPRAWDALIDSLGVPIAGTSFYNIDDFDGFTTYVGRFDFPASPGTTTRLYLRFDSKMESDRPGYRQILSREPMHPVSIIYPYSYAKYKNGTQLCSYGNYNYHRTLSRFDKEYSHVAAIESNNYSHMLVPVGDTGLFVISLGKGFFAPYGLNVLYAILACLLFSSYGIFFQAGRRGWRSRDASFKKRIRDNILVLTSLLMIVTTLLSIMTISAGFERRQSLEVLKLSKFVSREVEQYEEVEAGLWPEITRELERMADAIQVDVNIYSEGGELVATSLPLVFEKGLDGTLLNPEAHRRLAREHANSFVQEERVGELTYMAVYMPLELKNGKKYILSIPYFSESDELNREILFLVVISVNVTIIVIVLALFLSHVVAERMVKPLQMVNEKLRLMHLGGKNEKIVYNKQDEVGALVKEYNNMVDKLEESARRLSRVEREAAWQEMARQIAHEVKNPLTPMKLNIQFLRRALQCDNMEEVRRRFDNISAVLIEQIDHMAAIANAFSDFAKVSVATNEWFNFSEMVEGCARLFANDVEWMLTEIEPDIFLFGDKKQVNRVLVNLLKNAGQSIPKGRQGEISILLERRDARVILKIKDNGSGIPEYLRDRVAEPNFTTKSGGMGLGLPISYKIVEGMGGTIRFESEVGVGTTFIVSFREAKRGD